MEDLPSEMITEILRRVPKESLIPFRCVSKLWRRLIDIHLGLSFDWAFCLFPMVSSRLYCIDLLYGGDRVEIENPLGWERFLLLGSFQRLFCICDGRNGQLAIWHVAKQNCKLLPPADANILRRSGAPCTYGFGYDCREFVLLRVVQTSQRSVSTASIYKSRADTWRRLQGTLPYSLCEPGRMGVFLHGRLHWIMRRHRIMGGQWKSAKVLVAFDIRTESFVEVELPINNMLSMDLAVLKEQLCLTVYGELGVVDVWIMREYGLNGSWNLLFSLRDHLDLQFVRTLAYFKDGGRVLLQVSSTTLHWYNLQTRGLEPFHINGMPMSFEAATCLRL